ncbi:hypothetical protein H1W37_19320 [Stappia taiwanensis]|uniref:Uncharacterized protein n=1 Tax=Stappia taiwanensis TaxID=992267 RepID=A0A838Y3R5_9HYPH|nr:hypothetical protein [Stappia taiwanensis]MBA4613814.1 hypothetical protein [Stappia taiwanensis]GGE79325.1 hypothetical protein GCM10007285_03940 [Stappia taiwanensis]
MTFSITTVLAVLGGLLILGLMALGLIIWAQSVRLQRYHDEIMRLLEASPGSWRGPGSPDRTPHRTTCDTGPDGAQDPAGSGPTTNQEFPND